MDSYFVLAVVAAVAGLTGGFLILRIGKSTLNRGVAIGYFLGSLVLLGLALNREALSWTGLGILGIYAVVGILYLLSGIFLVGKRGNLFWVYLFPGAIGAFWLLLGSILSDPGRGAIAFTLFFGGEMLLLWVLLLLLILVGASPRDEDEYAIRNFTSVVAGGGVAFFLMLLLFPQEVSKAGVIALPWLFLLMAIGFGFGFLGITVASLWLSVRKWRRLGR